MTAPTASAPIVLFAYMRAAHLQRAVESLLRNPEAAQARLIVYCDAARRPEHRAEVEAVRRYADSIAGFAAVTRVHRDRNLGLAASIIGGVTEQLAAHDSVIVLEDDLVVSPHFLRYMNEGLSRYASEERVASVHGYAYPVAAALPETYFLRGADCWGWATWRRAWRRFEPDGRKLLAELRQRRLGHAFDLDGAYPYTHMLADQIAGRNDSWAVRWHASCFLADMLTLYPGRSLVANEGNDSSGTHGGFTRAFDVELAARPVDVAAIEIAESAPATRAVAAYFRRSRAIWRRLARRLRRYAAGARVGAAG